MINGLPRRCIACGGPFDHSDKERKLCHHCEVALERMNGYVAPIVHGRWINTPPYHALNGSYNKGQECSVCHAFFVSPGSTPYSNHPYCCECGAKMDLEDVNNA